jgi:hypothetical protein
MVATVMPSRRHPWQDVNQAALVSAKMATVAPLDTPRARRPAPTALASRARVP